MIDTVYQVCCTTSLLYSRRLKPWPGLVAANLQFTKYTYQSQTLSGILIPLPPQVAFIVDASRTH